MAIPDILSLPTNIGIANIIFSADNATAISQSPFTYAQQVIKHQGERWRSSVSLPPMKAVDAEYWVAFLLSLRGQYKTFYMGDPNYTAPRGTALTTKKNLLTYTEQFNNAAWTKTNANVTVTANTTTAPNGTPTADTGTISVGGTDSAIVESATVTNDFSAYTFSFYVKKIASEIGVRFDLRFIGGVTTLNYACLLTWSTLTITKGGSIATSTSVTDVDSGWYRVSVTGNNNSTGNTVAQLFIYPSASLIGTIQAGSVYLWGAQLEAGSTATSYQGIYDLYGPYVNGGSQTGSSLVIDGASPNQTGYLIAGDYIQLGSGVTSTLHKVLTSTDTNDLGQATLDLWPAIRTAPTDNSAITLARPKGRFRLSSNTASWEINNISSYGITFDCVEAI